MTEGTNMIVATMQGAASDGKALLPIMGVVFVAFLVIGIAMPVLPLHVHDGLGLGTFAVGLVTGSQFARFAHLATMGWPFFGHPRCQARRGHRPAGGRSLRAALSVIPGLYRGSAGVGHDPSAWARAARSGGKLHHHPAVSWGLALADARSTGKVIAWVGSAMFAAFAIGAPAGAALYAAYGFAAIAFATAAAPRVTLLLIYPVPSVAPARRARFSFARVVGAVWIPGLGSALGSVGFGAVATFVALLFASRGWANGWLAYTAYAAAFILAGVFFSHMADAIGGAKVALVCALIEAVGLALIWLSIRPETVLIGAALTGFGFSLVYPGFGVEAVRGVPAQSRGLAMGAYTAFLDLAQGFASPVLGLIATGARLNVVFLASSLTVLCAAFIASWLIAHPTTIEGCPQ
jgi:hypothetical protein